MDKKTKEERKKELEYMDKLLENSTLTEEDAERIGNKIKHVMYKRFERLHKKESKS